MALRANLNSLESSHSPMVEKITPLGEELVAVHEGLLSQVLFQTFNGCAMSLLKRSSNTQPQIRRDWMEARHSPVAPVAELCDFEVHLSGALCNRNEIRGRQPLPTRIEKCLLGKSLLTLG